MLFFPVKSLQFVDIEDLVIDYTKVHNSTTSEFIEIAHYVEPSMETFYKKMFMPKVPAVLEGNITFSIVISAHN